MVTVAGRVVNLGCVLGDIGTAPFAPCPKFPPRVSSATNQPSSPFCFIDFLSGVRIDLQAIPGEVRSVLEQINLMDIDPDKLTPAQLDKIAEHLIQKALAGKPEAMVAEARRRLEAGETVTVEAIETTSEAT